MAMTRAEMEFYGNVSCIKKSLNDIHGDMGRIACALERIASAMDGGGQDACGGKENKDEVLCD